MEKINKLRNLLKKKNIDGYFIPKNDEFFSEYIPDHKDRLKYISNFSGSFGFVIILNKKNYLFVDGRYTLQAKKQSERYFEVKTIPKEIPKNVFKKKRLKIGFDPKICTKKFLSTLFEKTKCELIPLGKNFIDEYWVRKNKTKVTKFYVLPEKSIGDKYQKKVNKVVSFISKNGADAQFITSSENVAWLLNIRGKDSKFSPVPNSYILIKKNKKINFFCDTKKISYSLRKNFHKIRFIDIKLTNKILSKLENERVLIDKNTCSVYFENLLSKNNKILNLQDPIYALKAVKSKKEIKNTIKSHIYDGAALTKFLFWIKKNYINKNLSELSVEKKLYNLRKKNKDFKFLSFPTISGTGPNGAIIHYKATKESNLKLKKGNIYLVDSGGQYNFGTTDVTRTVSLNNSKKRIKNIFTRVLKGHIAVANFNLRSDTTGSQIDSVARKYLKQINLDYPHGTGHGVGYFLNVHEGPHAISKNNNINFREGMIVSNEPGYYEKNKFGIRIENLVYVKKLKGKTFFENLTMVPIDKNLIDISLLNNSEKEWINKYHGKVFNSLKNYMNKVEILDLDKACSAI